MTIAQDIISRRMPDFDAYLRAGNSLDDIDEYGFTPLIESIITRQFAITEQLLQRKVLVNKPDVAGRTPLHWAVDKNDFATAELLLNQGANPNAYTPYALSILVYPVLRGQDNLKHLLYQHGAKLDFALDFIYGKLIGHRFELSGDVDILNTDNKFIELDYEGFMLEFTVASLRDSLRRFISSYSTRHLREHFLSIHLIMDAFELAEELLQFQHLPLLQDDHRQRIAEIANAPMLILPAASRGHAMGFVRAGECWGKIDRGENSLQEGTVNIYKISRPQKIDGFFLQNFLYKKQSRAFFHQQINQQLGLQPVIQMPISAQISGNCSWANIQAIMPVAFAMQNLNDSRLKQALTLYDEWIEWDKERAIDDCIQRFYSASNERKVTIAAMLGAILFQACKYSNQLHIQRAEKILSILTLPEYSYILNSYLQTYCVKRLTKKGNNLLKILDDCGINPDIDVHPVATDF